VTADTPESEGKGVSEAFPIAEWDIKGEYINQVTYI